MPRYFANIPRASIHHPDGPAKIAVHARPQGGMQIGSAFFSGHNALGDPVWSLRIGGRWVGGRWVLELGEFWPAQ